MKNDFIVAIERESMRLGSGDLYRKGIRFNISAHNTHVSIDRLRALSPRRKAGSEFMQWFTKAASEYGVGLRVRPVAAFMDWDQKNGDPQQKLIEWYGRFGFQDAGNCEMHRLP